MTYASGATLASFSSRRSKSNGSLVTEWKDHTDIVSSITISPNGKFIASGSWDRTARLWDMTTPTRIGPILCDDKVNATETFSRVGETIGRFASGA
ncbi:hypothetical protein BS17DRAFT_788487 [Gyrodon lividus]|nr:hypothetical protein BS17DRAFT_788487 [Gyrodon lividus]